MNHIRIWGACLLDIPKEREVKFFVSTKDKKVFVSTYATFLEYNYMKNYKPKSTIILKKLAFSQKTPKTLEIPPQVSVCVQGGENVPESEQT